MSIWLYLSEHCNFAAFSTDRFNLFIRVIELFQRDHEFANLSFDNIFILLNDENIWDGQYLHVEDDGLQQTTSPEKCYLLALFGILVLIPLNNACSWIEHEPNESESEIIKQDTSLMLLINATKSLSAGEIDGIKYSRRMAMLRKRHIKENIRLQEHLTISNEVKDICYVSSQAAEAFTTVLLDSIKKALRNLGATGLVIKFTYTVLMVCPILMKLYILLYTHCCCTLHLYLRQNISPRSGDHYFI